MVFTIVTPLAERFTQKYEIAASGCWLWTACTNDNGYGLIWVLEEGKKLYAHRVSYELHVGPIPEGLHIDHLCRVRSCVNPDHLEPVTQAENTKRAAAVRTHCSNNHEYTAENTATYRGYRRCRACDRENHRATYIPKQATEKLDLADFFAGQVDNDGSGKSQSN